MELKQLEGMECTRNSVPVNFPLEEMEILAVGIPGTPQSQRGICLFVRAAVMGARNRKVFVCELIPMDISETPERTCLRLLDGSEMQLHIPSPLPCQFSPSFPLPEYVWTGTALWGCVR